MARQTERPLSPHLLIYKPQITSMMSIFQRITGVGLAIGSLLLTGWLLALASGPEAFACATAILAHPLSQLALIAWTASFYFHMLNGIRFLFWDTGRGFELTTVNRTAIAVLAGTVILTAATFIVSCFA